MYEAVYVYAVVAAPHWVETGALVLQVLVYPEKGPVVQFAGMQGKPVTLVVETDC